MKINWNRWVPLGLNGGRIRNWLCFFWGCALGYGMIRFVSRLSNAVQKLYVWKNTRRYLIPGAVIAPFSELLKGCLAGHWLLAAAMPAAAMVLYLFHYQNGRSIYTMKRLPDRWELWRRVGTLPLTMTLLSLLSAPVMTGVYYLLYVLATPKGCLPG